MSDRKGWVKLFRSILDNPIAMKSLAHFGVWCILLLTATSKSRKAWFNGEEIILKPGQIITGRKQISDFFKDLNESKVQRVLKDFEGAQQIEQQTTSQNRLITLINWDKYQINEQHFEQQVNNGFDKKTSSQNRKPPISNIKTNSKSTCKNGSNTELLPAEKDFLNNDLNNDLNNKRTATEQQLNSKRTLNKNRENVKNVENEREGALSPLGQFKNVVLTQNELDELMCQYPNDYQKKIERLSRYLASTGKNYQNHFATLIDWLKSDEAAQPKKKSDSSIDYEKLNKLTIPDV